MQSRRIFQSSFLLTLVLASLASAQRQEVPETVTLPEELTVWDVPIHGQPNDTLARYGLWASRETYKVEFTERGFAFYPVLGTSYPENLPLAWRTTEISIGDRNIVADRAPEAVTDAWRYELHHDEVVEAYDVLERGVEQTFTFAHGPSDGTDIVVRGRVTTRLEAIPRSAAHGPLTFLDASGQPIVSYGAAFAIDATGERLALDSAFDGTHVTLRIPGEWLCQANWPVVLDPLTQRVAIPPTQGAGNQPASYPNIARDDANDRLLVVYSRAVSASDYDLWARRTTDSFSHLGAIFTDIAASWSTRYASVAWVGGASRWAIAIQRDLAARSAIRVYVHETSNTTLNSGALLFLNPPAGSSDQTPSIGGQTSLALDGRAYLAFRRDLGGPLSNTDDSRVHGVVVDTLAGTFGTVNDLHNTTTQDYDAEAPCVTQDAGRTGSWVVAWQEFNRVNRNDDWDVLASRVTRTGGISSNAALGHSGTSSLHKLYPQVAGSGGRYMLSYFMRDNTSPATSFTANQLHVERFDWNESATSPTNRVRKTISQHATNVLQANVTNRAIAYDTNTDSHWALAYRTTANDVSVVRLGSTGGVVERAVVFADPLVAGFSPTVCYNDDDYEFALVYATNEAPGDPLYGVRFSYYPDTLARRTGNLGCAGNVVATNRGTRQLPFAGSEFFGVQLQGGRPLLPTVIYASIAERSFPLGNGCTISLDPTVLVELGVGVSDLAGDYAVALPLPDDGTTGDVFFQAFQLDGGQVVSSTALRVQVR